MRYGKIGAGCLAAALCLGAMPAPAWAGTPEFAYTAEQWASLRDNQLDFTEIADLIHVYNNTVIQNQLEYEDFRGEDADDIADDYYDAADDIYGSLEYPDSSDSDYASRLSSYLSSQIQADNLREQGDDNVEDGDVKKLEYDKTEAGLVKEAQELMISYWSQTYSLESLEQNKIQAQSSYDQTLTPSERRYVHPGPGAVGPGGRHIGGCIPAVGSEQSGADKRKSLPYAGMDLWGAGGYRRCAGAGPGGNGSHQSG